MASTLTDGVEQKVYDKYEVNDATSAALGQGEVIPVSKRVSIGQAKYAVRCGVDSIYDDKSRDTADDRQASEVAMEHQPMPSDQSQGGKY